MATLSAHLRRSEDHGRLPFHPQCPVCREERLSGTLPGPSPVARRAQAVVVAGVLAASTATPTVAAAQEADQVVEGVAPEQEAGGATDVDPGLDPGGVDEDLPFDATEDVDSEPAVNPEADDDGALEVEPVADEAVPVADAGEEAPPVPNDGPSAASPANPGPSVDTRAHVVTLGPTEAPARPRLALVARSRPKPQPVAPREDPAVARPTVKVLVAQTAPEVATSTKGAATEDDRFHVVRPGESLWSIARDVLGRDASPARIARVVNQLWERNSAHIATGDPDMLRVGTRLTLP